MRTPEQALAHFEGKDSTGKSIFHYMVLFYGEILKIVSENDRREINKSHGW